MYYAWKDWGGREVCISEINAEFNSGLCFSQVGSLCLFNSTIQKFSQAPSSVPGSSPQPSLVPTLLTCPMQIQYSPHWSHWGSVCESRVESLSPFSFRRAKKSAAVKEGIDKELQCSNWLALVVWERGSLTVWTCFSIFSSRTLGFTLRLAWSKGIIHQKQSSGYKEMVRPWGQVLKNKIQPNKFEDLIGFCLY